MIIDHIGVVVKSMEQGISHWIEVFGYEQMTEVVENTRQHVRVVFLSKQGSTQIKLIEPVDEASPTYAFAARGGGLHHICFRCDDLHETLENLKEHKLRILARPQTGGAFDNEEIAFVYAKHGLNIELIDTDKRAKLL